MKKIAVLFTTFKRNFLAADTLHSIIEARDPNWEILIGDQNEQACPPHFSLRMDDDPIEDHIKYYHLPFDCGLSAARNALVKKAEELGCEYCLLTADSIQFTKPLDLKPIIDFLDRDPKRGIVGLKLENRVSWEYNMEINPGISFVLTKPNEFIEEDKIKYTKCDICKNFFLAKTEALLNVPWDEELKLSEHEDHSWRFKQSGWERYFTDHCSAVYVDNKPPEYVVYRNRMYQEYRKKLQNKYGIRGWVEVKNN